MKLNIILENNWIEATWNVDGIQIHCESFSGHPEHIVMLEAKALEFGTPLDEYSELIEQLASTYIAPTQEELDEIEGAQKLSEARAYLNSTDYKMTVDYFATLTKEIQDELVSKRAEAREYIRDNA